jgi:sigma-E factor negative regulatory protein RseC
MKTTQTDHKDLEHHRNITNITINESNGMIEEVAEVITIEPGYARIRAMPSGGCGSCSSKKTCTTSLLFKASGKKDNTIRVLNPVYAKPGERVVVGIHPGALLKGSFLAYILPLLTLILFAVAGSQLFPLLGLNAEVGSILMGLSGLFFGLYASRLLSQNNRVCGTDMEPVILRHAVPVQHPMEYVPTV